MSETKRQKDELFARIVKAIYRLRKYDEDRHKTFYIYINAIKSVTEARGNGK